MKKLQATWKMCDEPLVIPDDVRRQLLRHVLMEEDADWGVVRSPEALEGQLDYLLGLRPEPHWATEADFTLIQGMDSDERQRVSEDS